MNNFFTRVITAIFFAALFIGGIYYNEYTVIGLFSVVTVISLLEFYKHIFQKIQGQNNYWPVAAGFMLFISITLVAAGLVEKNFIAMNVFFVVIIFISQLYSKYERPFKAIAYKLIGLVYVSLPFALFCALGFMHTSHYNYELPLGFIFLLWSNDTGAYLFGMTMGRNKLFERISPKKSWEGFIGGLVVAIIIAVVISHFYLALNRQQWIVTAILIVIFGTFGDLVESMFKRSMNVKDSGTILPGHGGILDRFDGLLIAAPVVYAYLVLFS